MCFGWVRFRTFLMGIFNRLSQLSHMHKSPYHSNATFLYVAFQQQQKKIPINRLWGKYIHLWCLNRTIICQYHHPGVLFFFFFFFTVFAMAPAIYINTFHTVLLTTATICRTLFFRWEDWKLSATSGGRISNLTTCGFAVCLAFGRALLKKQ